MNFFWNCERCGRLLDAESFDIEPDEQGWFVTCPACQFSSKLIHAGQPGRPNKFIKLDESAKRVEMRRRHVH